MVYINLVWMWSFIKSGASVLKIKSNSYAVGKQKRFTNRLYQTRRVAAFNTLCIFKSFKEFILFLLCDYNFSRSFNDTALILLLILQW